MPNAYIDGPKIESVATNPHTKIFGVGTKQALVKEVTDAMGKAYKFPRQAYVVTITENQPENVGVAGELIADRGKK